MRAQPGAGLLFDFLKAEVSNAGGDQSQTFSLRMEKMRAYRLDGNVRRFNYYRSPGPNFALGFRNSDLRQQVSDFNLKLFPQRAVRINAGYGRSYEIFLLDPKSGRAIVQGGKYFAEPVEAIVSGSTFGGCMLKMGWIGVGLRMEFYVNGKRTVTSPVQSLRVERVDFGAEQFGVHSISA